MVETLAAEVNRGVLWNLVVESLIVALDRDGVLRYAEIKRSFN